MELIKTDELENKIDYSLASRKMCQIYNCSSIANMFLLASSKRFFFGRKIPNLTGFTLVELIVVISILAILGTIAFISMGSYLASARDSARISDLSSLRSALEIHEVKTGRYPMVSSTSPNKTVTYSGSEVFSEGIMDDTMARTLRIINKAPLDPKYSQAFYDY